MKFDNPIEFLREVIKKKEAAGPADDRDTTLGILTAVMETIVENKVEIALALLREAGAEIITLQEHANVDTFRDEGEDEILLCAQSGDTVAVIKGGRCGRI